MKRFAVAAILLAAFGTTAAAQPFPTAPPSGPPPGPIVLPPAPPPPDVQFVPPVLPPGPAIPFVKSGNVVVGADGYYPYDTGAYLLAGDRGLYRYGGYFTMMMPGGPAVGDTPVIAGPYVGGRGHFHGKFGHFRR